MDWTIGHAETANWITSVVTMRLTRVIKDTGFGVVNGTRLEFTQTGGWAQIGAVTVDAIVPWRLPMLEGRQYLVFGTRREGKYSHIGAYEVKDAGLLRKASSTSVRKLRAAEDDPITADDEVEQIGLQQTVNLLEDEVLRGISEGESTGAALTDAIRRQAALNCCGVQCSRLIRERPV
jgi:hypothetical protein